MSIVDYSVDGDVAVLTVNYPPVNALSLATRKGMWDALDQAEADPTVRAIIIIGAGSTFIAGADITEFGTPNGITEPRLSTIQQRLEACDKLTIAAVHGTALGGGLELALTCKARIAVASAKFGLPEVNLGILPGAGGTQRLPRLTGPEIALDLIISGKHINASKALELGVVDAVVEELLDGAMAFARAAISEGRTFQHVGTRQEKVSGVDPKLFADFRAKTLPQGERFSPILHRLVDAGRFGMKTGKGFYRYEGREKSTDPEAMAIIKSISKELGITRRAFSDDEVCDRLFMPLVNEGAKILEDGIAIRASDIDTVWVNGYGFPSHRGGPMYWGAQIGLDKVYALAVELGERNGPRWMPGKLLERLVKEGKGWD